MALQNQNGNYLKIKSVDLDRGIIHTEIYKDVNTRTNPSDFDLAQPQAFHVKQLADAGDGYTSTGNLFDDVKTVAYAALKTEPPFNGAGGEVWTDC